jgi:hypothetical protein
VGYLIDENGVIVHDVGKGGDAILGLANLNSASIQVDKT